MSNPDLTIFREKMIGLTHLLKKELESKESTIPDRYLSRPAADALILIAEEMIKEKNFFSSKLHMEQFLDPNEERRFASAAHTSVYSYVQWVRSFLKSHASATPESIWNLFEVRLNAQPECVLYLPLFNVDFSNLSPELHEPFKFATLKRLDEEEKEYLSHFVSFIKTNRFYTKEEVFPRWAFVFKGKATSNEAEAKLTASLSEIEKFRFILSLYGVDAICPFTVKGRSDAWHRWNGAAGSYPAGNYGLGNIITLGDEHTKHLFRDYSLVSDSMVSRFRIAVERLAVANGREVWQDQVIDLSIALENLVNAETEIAFRLSTYLPALIEQDKEKRISLSKLISSFYDLRSCIVHGNDKRIQKALKRFGNAPSDFHFREIRRIIRAALRSFFSHPEIVDAGYAQVILGDGVFAGFK